MPGGGEKQHYQQALASCQVVEPHYGSDLRGVPGTPVPGAELAFNPVLMSVGGQDLRESDLKELGWSDEQIAQTWYGAEGGDEAAQGS